MNPSYHLDEALNELRGLNADQIAALLRSRGIKGRPGTTYKCPLAQFFKLDHPGSFIVGSRFIMRRSSTRANAQPEKANTPRNLAAFLQRFDRGEYPDLIALPPRCVPKSTDRRKGDRHKIKTRHPRTRINNFARDVERFLS